MSLLTFSKLRRLEFAPLCIILLCCFPEIVCGLSFSVGNYYGTYITNNTISEYSSTGNVLGSLNIPVGNNLAGIAFGPDNLMYVVATGVDKVLAIDENGTIKRTYTPSDPLDTWPNASYGKIAFGQDGHFYVASRSGITAFSIYNTASSSKIPNTAGNFDVKVLPNNNLLVANSSYVMQIDSAGTVITSYGTFGGIQGIEYDPFSNNIYVSTLGYTGVYDIIYKLNAATGQIIQTAHFSYPEDLFITRDRHLLVGSRAQSPALFTLDLEFISSFEGPDAFFITQYIPEPATLLLLGLGAVMVRRKP